MPDFPSGIVSFLDPALSFAAFFLVDVAFVCDFLPATSGGVDVLCVVDLNLVEGTNVDVSDWLICIEVTDADPALNEWGRVRRQTHCRCRKRCRAARDVISNRIVV